MRFRCLALIVFAAAPLATPLAADEGMWLFNNFPKENVKTKHSFDVSDDLLTNLRLGTLRIGTGSGSFVSPNGLILTTRRLVADCIAALGKDSFYAPAPDAELACPGLTADVLVALDDVTAQVKAAPAVAASLEKTCAQKTGDVCVVTKFYAGERYDLYQYHR